jgi:hypothetical protein
MGKMGSLPPLAAFAHQKNWIEVPSVRFLQFPNLVCGRSEGPQSALCEGCRLRPGADVRNIVERCSAASPERPFVDCAAFGRPKRRSADRVSCRWKHTDGRFDIGTEGLTLLTIRAQ